MRDLHTLIGHAASAITHRRGHAPASGDATKGDEEHPLDGLLFMGNPHETVPRSLLLDRRLGAVDVLGWQMIRLLSNPDRTTAFPTYDQLEDLLRSGAGKRASRKTVARVIAVLRLTRWMTLGMKARNTTNGRMIGNIYVLHDEPLAPGEAMTLDQDYLEYVIRCTHHGNAAVSAVAKEVKRSLTDTGVLTQPTRLELLDQRAAQQEQGAEFPAETAPETAEFPTETQGKTPSSLGKLSEFPTEAPPSFPWKLMGESSTYDRVSAGNSATTVRSYTNTVGSTTTAGARDLVWSWPLELTADQREAVTLLLTGLPNEIQQAVIDEAAGRMAAGKVKNTMAFLHTLAKRAASDQFQITHFGAGVAAKRGEPTPPASPMPSIRPLARQRGSVSPSNQSPPETQVNSEQGQRDREEVLKRLRIRR